MNQVTARLRIVCSHGAPGKAARIGTALKLHSKFLDAWDFDIRSDQKRQAALRAAWDPDDDFNVFRSKYLNELKKRGLPAPPSVPESFSNYTDDEGNVFSRYASDREKRFRLTCERARGGCGVDVEFREIHIRDYLDRAVRHGVNVIELLEIDAILGRNTNK